MRKLIVLWSVVGTLSACSKKKEEEAPAPASSQPPVEQKAVEAKPPAEPAKPAVDPKVIERGAYIAKAGACVICHTAIGPTGPDLANAFAGGLEMPDPMGTWRTPNITQDKGTGIGNWTDDQIARVIREGVRPDGSQLYAIMPYMNYNRLSDDDTKALVAFLRTIKPIEKTTAPNKDLKIPKIPAPKPEGKADPAEDKLKHGEYLASVMLCNHCHWTPDKNFAPAGPDKMFSGGLAITAPMLGSGTIYTKNITSDPETGIGKWTEDQVYTVIKTMRKPDGTQIQGPMLFMQGTWSQMDDNDLHAVAAFIKSLPAVKNKIPASTFKPNPPPSAAGAPAAGTPAAAPATGSAAAAPSAGSAAAAPSATK